MPKSVDWMHLDYLHAYIHFDMWRGLMHTVHDKGNMRFFLTCAGSRFGALQRPCWPTGDHTHTIDVFVTKSA